MFSACRAIVFGTSTSRRTASSLWWPPVDGFAPAVVRALPARRSARGFRVAAVSRCEGGEARVSLAGGPKLDAATQSCIAPRLRPTRQRTSPEGQIAFPATTYRSTPIAVSRKDQTHYSINQPTPHAVSAAIATRALTFAITVHDHCLPSSRVKVNGTRLPISSFRKPSTKPLEPSSALNQRSKIRRDVGTSLLKLLFDDATGSVSRVSCHSSGHPSDP